MAGNEQIEAQHHADNQQRLDAMEVAQAATNEAMAMLAADVHALKGTIAANTSFTREALAGIDAIKALISELDIPSLKDMGETMAAMRGGVKVLGWLERPAKWIAAIAGAAAALYALWKIK